MSCVPAALLTYLPLQLHLRALGKPPLLLILLAMLAVLPESSKSSRHSTTVIHIESELYNHPSCKGENEAVSIPLNVFFLAVSLVFHSLYYVPFAS